MKNKIIQPGESIRCRTFGTLNVWASIAALLAVTFGARAALAEAPATAPADVDIDSLPVKAPDVGSITQRTTTGARDGPKFGLYLFSPGAVGATVKEHPTFYWYLAQPNDEDTEVVVTEVSREKVAGKLSQISILMRKTYTGTQPQGIYAATLDEAALQPNKLYQVSVVVHRADDQVFNSIGYLTRVADTGVNADDPAACAKAGLWYDAIDAAMRRSTKDTAGVGHRQLHALLRGEHVFSTAAPAGPADPAAVRAASEQEKAIFDGLDALHDALIMTKPPEKKKHGR
jgi:hypothetical protein